MTVPGTIAKVWLLTSTALAAIVDYPRPEIYNKSPHFSLKVNNTYMHTVNYAKYDYVQLSMDEGYPTEFRIAMTIADQPKIDTYSITPAQLPISARVEGNELIFSLKKAHYLIIRLNLQKEFVVMIDPMENSIPSTKGQGIYNVLDYKADNAGASVTKGIQSALDAAAQEPGSIVYVPPGLYQIGHLMLRSKTSLYLAGGSVLRFTGNPSDYKQLYTKHDLGAGTWWIQTEFGSTDITVYGRGTIDGNGRNTRENKFMASILVPAGTTNFRCDGILFRDSSFWAVMPVQSEGVYMTNMKILNQLTVSQNDGVDVCESKRVTIRRAIAIANDDSFSVKTWPEKTGTTVPYPYPPRALSDVVFEDCLAWTTCYGYKVGMGVWQNHDNVTFRNSVVYKAGIGIGVLHSAGKAVTRDITFENIDIERVSGGAPQGQQTWLSIWVDDTGTGAGPVERVTVKNIQVRELGGRYGNLKGFSTLAMVDGLTLSNIFVKGNSKPATILEEMKITRTDFSKNIRIEN